MSPSPFALLLALGIGLLVGLERERRKGEGPQRGAAGLRSFALAALAGALAQSLGTSLTVVGAVLVGALAAISHARSRSDDPGMTTELALFCTYLTGALATVAPTLAAGCGAGLAFLLEARSRLHHFATRWLSAQELRDALLLGVLALVVLPLIPDRALPALGGINPRPVALVAVLIFGVQALSHLAVRWLGARAGLAVAGALAGWASSTAAIASLGTLSRHEPQQRAALAAAAAWSTTATWALALVMAGVLSPQAAAALAPAMLGGLLASLLACAALSGLAHRGAAATDAEPLARQQAVSLREAARLALLLAAVTWLVSHAHQWFGPRGLMLGIAIAGLADAHSSVLSLTAMFTGGQLDAPMLVSALLLAIATSSATRLVVAVATGGWRFGLRVAAALAAGLAGAWLAWGLVH